MAAPDNSSSSSETRGENPSPLLWSALLFVAVLLLYRGTFSSDFVTLDDPQYVIDNEIVRDPGWDGVGRFLTEVMAPSTVAGYYQPLTMLSLMADALLSGDPRSPFVYHATNILLHALNAVLVFLVMRMVLDISSRRAENRGGELEAAGEALGSSNQELKRSDSKGKPLNAGLAIPLLLAAFFAIHPMQVESVAWVSQRKTVLATCFALLSVLSYLRYGRDGRTRYLAGAFVLLVLGNLAKPTLMLMPLVLMLLDVWPLRRHILRALPEKTPFFALMLAAGYVAWRSQKESASLGAPNLPPEMIPKWIGLISYNLMLYLGNVVWPMHLSPYRAFPDELSLADPPIALAVAGTVVFFVLVLWARKRCKPFFVGAAAFITLLAPALGAVQFDASCVADRFLYLPFVFLLLPLGAMLQWAVRLPLQRPQVLLACVALFLAPLAILTHAQQTMWRDSQTFWSQVVESAPKLARGNYNMALLQIEAADYEAARDSARKALEAEPENANFLYALGYSLSRAGAPQEAIPLLQKALRLGLGDKEAVGHLALAEAHLIAEDRSAAQLALEQATDLGVAPGVALARLGQAALHHARRCDWAQEYYADAVAAVPDDLEIRFGHAEALCRCGRKADALAEYDAIIERAAGKGLRFPRVEEARAAVQRELESKRVAEPFP